MATENAATLMKAGVPRSVLVRYGCTMTMPVPMSAV
jgi:hypothetical protein